MSSRQLTNSRRLGGFPSVLLALLALVSQLALGAVVLPDAASAQDQSVAALEALSVLCDSSKPNPPGQPGHRQHDPDRALCPLAVALALPVFVLAAGPELPLPSRALADTAPLVPQARAPPALPRQTPPSRGPPILS